MVCVLAGVKDLGRAAALAQRTGRGPPSHVWERERERGDQEEPGWEGAQAQGRGLVLGDPSWCTGGQGGYPQAGHSSPSSLWDTVTLWVLLETLGLALTPGKPGVSFLS